ncbi:hypothetical protein D9M73_232710 [compost metagenome]
MPLSIQQIQEMTSGFAAAGYACIERPGSPKNPVKLKWTDIAGTERRARLWVYEVRHGGKGRNDEEFRIQVTSSPSSQDGMDHGGVIYLLMAIRQINEFWWHSTGDGSRNAWKKAMAPRPPR